MFFSEKYLEMVETSETSQATVGESTNIGLDQDVKKGEMDTNEAFNHPLATSWWPVGDRKSELTELEALHMRYVRMNHIDISYTQRFMITRCLYLSVSKYVIYIYIYMSIYAHTRSYRFFYRSLPTCSRCALSSLATESWVVRSRNHVFSSWNSPQLRVYTFLMATIWLFNIAMENHHFL